MALDNVRTKRDAILPKSCEIGPPSSAWKAHYDPRNFKRHSDITILWARSGHPSLRRRYPLSGQSRQDFLRRKRPLLTESRVEKAQRALSVRPAEIMD